MVAFATGSRKSPLFVLAVETSSSALNLILHRMHKTGPIRGRAMAEKLRKEDSAWKKQLTQNQYSNQEERDGTAFHRRYETPKRQEPTSASAAAAVVSF